MDSKEFVAIGVFALFVIYGIFNLIAAPVVARRFYKKYGFSDLGFSSLDTPGQSILLDSTVTRHLHEGNHQARPIQHAKVMLQKRSLLTFSKRKRKVLQARWSVTQLVSESPLTEFTLLPKTDPGTVALMMTDAGVDLSVDEALDLRYLCRTEEMDVVVPLIVGPLKEFLLNRNLAAIEVIDNTVIIKRAWPSEHFEKNMLAEFDAAGVIVDCLTGDSLPISGRMP